MEKIYVVIQKNDSTPLVNIRENAKAALEEFNNMFTTNPSADLKVVEFDRSVFYANVAANYKLTAWIGEGTIVNPVTLVTNGNVQ